MKKLFSDATEENCKDMIKDGIFCNPLCRRSKLSTKVMNVTSHSLLHDLLSVFKDPSTKIGHYKQWISCSSVVVVIDSGARASMGSDSDDERHNPLDNVG